MKRLSLLVLCLFGLLQAYAQFTQQGRTLEYHGRKNKTIYTSPISISFQGCSSTTNDNLGNLSLVFPNAKAGNVVSCTEMETSNPEYVVYNRNEFDIWTLGDRILPVVLCKKSKIDNYITIYTNVQMNAYNAKYEAKKRELEKSELDKKELSKKIEQLTREHSNEIKEIKENALIFAYIDEEKLDSLQYEQHLCLLNNDIEGAVELGKQIDFKNNISKQLSNFEKSISKTQEIGLKLFQKAEALYLHVTNCELLSVDEDSLKEDYEILIKCYRTLIEQYPNNFKCTADLYSKIKAKLGKILYKYAKLYLIYRQHRTLADDDNKLGNRIDTLTYCYMKEVSLYKNSDAILWIVINGDNYNERKLYAKNLINGIKSGELSIPGEYYSFFDIKEICESFPDFQIEDKDKILYYSIIGESTVSVVHFHSKNHRLNKIKIPQSVKYQGRDFIVTQIGVAAFGDGSYEEDILKVGIFRNGLKVSNNFFGKDNKLLNVRTVDSEKYRTFIINLPKTIEYVGSAAFFPRLSLIHIKINGIPEKLKILRRSSFMGCSFGKKIILPHGIEKIEADALPASGDCSFSLPNSLKELDWLNGSCGGTGNNSIGKILDINNNPNFRLIDGALYNADSSYVYLGTVGQYNKRLHITRNMKFDEYFLDRLHYTSMMFETKEFVDSICLDERNPYYSYYDHCIYTKNLDTLLYILPSANNVRLSTKLSCIYEYLPIYFHYEIPVDMSIEGMNACLDEFIGYGGYKFEFFGKEYGENEYEESESNLKNPTNKSEYLDLIIRDNKNNLKLLCLKALLYLEDDKFFQGLELLDSINCISDFNHDYNELLYLQDSYLKYEARIGKCMEEYQSTDTNNHSKMVDICLNIRGYLNNTADYFNTEKSVYNAFFINWVLGAQESYINNRYSFMYMEKGVPYALKLINEFNIEKYRNDVSDFFASLARFALYNDEEKSKFFQYIQKSLELNSNNIEAYEALGLYFYYYGGEEKKGKIRDLIVKVEKIDSNYSNSKGNLLYKLLSNEDLR